MNPLLHTKNEYLLLAPMEGITDFLMRDMLTQIGGIDHCVTEFLRVTDKLHPYSVFYKNCPELKTNSRTLSQTPVFLQLLGGQADPLAENARRAAELGAYGIDLNFGCPAKTVNRHDGGASLLKTPERIFNIVLAVRKAVPSEIPVSVKMRLGCDDTNLCLENAKAVDAAGASFLTVHCRTKLQGYRPPAYWHWIPEIKSVVRIPVIANGDITSIDDFKKCKEITGVKEYMIGRAALNDPWIFHKIKNLSTQPNDSISTGLQANSLFDNKSEWEKIKPLLPGFFEACSQHINIHFATSRTKQWLKSLFLKHKEVHDHFQTLKVLKNKEFQKKLEEICSH